MKYPQHLLKIIEILKRLPGVGTKSAERFAFQMLAWPTHNLQEIGDLIKTIPDKLKHCPFCGCLMGGEELCELCSHQRCETAIICIIAHPRDAFSIEATGEYRGLYHVLGGVLSPLEGIGPEQLGFSKLKERISSLNIQEVIIALDSTLEGDATALYLKQELRSFQIPISRLAFGLPMGSSLEYVDGGTLARAFTGRGQF